MSLPTIVSAVTLALSASHDRGQVAVASWFYDAGPTASGRHYPHGFASLLFGSRWGTRVRFCHDGFCAIGRLEDHGPYVYGRSFDLNPSLRDALRCGGICYVRWTRPRYIGYLVSRRVGYLVPIVRRGND